MWHQQIKILLPINVAHYKLVEFIVLLVLSICYKLDELIWTVNLKVLTVKPRCPVGGHKAAPSGEGGSG